MSAPTAEQIFPRLKVDYNHSAHKGSGQSDPALELPQDQQPLLQPLAGDLLLAFGLDTGEQYMLLQQNFLERNPQLAGDALRHLAVQNMLRECGDKIQLHEEAPGVCMVTCGGNFEATLLLADGLWENLQPHFPEGLLAAAPASDLLFAVNDSPEGLAQLTGVVLNCFRNPEIKGHLSRLIFRRSENQWDVATTVSEDF